MIQGLDALLSSWVTGGKMFTALDVSNEIKKTQPTVRHREVRDEVRAWMNTHAYLNNYTTTTIQVTEFNTQTKVDAILYHMTGDNPDNYTERGQRATPPAKKNDSRVFLHVNSVQVPMSAYAFGGQVTAATNYPVAGKKTNPVMVLFNKDRIRVPARVVNELNAAPGNGFKVTTSKGKIILSLSKQAADVFVTNDNRINVTSYWLDQVFTSLNSPFNVYVENGEVVISQ